MEDNKVLAFEELDSVAGGRDKALVYLMTAEENAHLDQLQKNYKDAGVRYFNGEGSKADMDAAYQEVMDYIAEMQRKYP